MRRLLPVLLSAGSTLLCQVGLCAATDARHLMLGTLTLGRCETPAPWCGRLARPLDPSGSYPGQISIYFEYFPHTRPGRAAGMLVATEGGPGYPATESRNDYLALFAPLRERYDVLIMDNRGTGRSAAIDCEPLQRAALITEEDVGECGRSLGERRRFFGTALAGDDLAAVLAALQVAQISLYGDSYGTYFAQVFALRHPQLLRALVLDGAYPLEGPDYAWYPHYAPAMRAKFDLACERDAACRALGGSSMDHIAAALTRLRQSPRETSVHYGEHREARIRADASRLATVMFASAPAFSSVRETDAAARAFQAGDERPLLRLMAETTADVDSRDASKDARSFSAGLAAAVSCQDPPQVFDMSMPVARRLEMREQLMAQRRRESPQTYAPFTLDEYRGMPLDYAFIDECARWPQLTAPTLTLTGLRYPQIPVLIVSGELDDMTSVADGAAAAAHFPRARHVVIANSFHVNALPRARSACGARLVRHFLEQLALGDERCASAVPPVRLVPRFARSVSELEPARAADGAPASRVALQAVSAALQSCADAISRGIDNGAGDGVGLRGGSYRVGVAGEGYRITLDALRWTEDLAVSGRIDWPGRSGLVHAQLTLDGAAPGTLDLSWQEGVADAQASAQGELAGAKIRALAPAP